MQYPKALYLEGRCRDPEALDGTGHHVDSVVVRDEEEESAANVNGYWPIDQAPEQAAPVPDELAQLKARAVERGLVVKGNWGVKKLREVLGD
jgi:hypothetical protein